MLSYQDITLEMAEIIGLGPCAFTSETLILVWKFLSDQGGEGHTSHKTTIVNVLASRHRKQMILEMERPGYKAL